MSNRRSSTVFRVLRFLGVLVLSIVVLFVIWSAEAMFAISPPGPNDGIFVKLVVPVLDLLFFIPQLCLGVFGLLRDPDFSGTATVFFIMSVGIAWAVDYRCRR
ncbi:MAG: hypothetical protein HY077_11720 [Elusimicrobia bacterium]|nr:hypothetical protein [Elusimicrobiota bacterium]